MEMKKFLISGFLAGIAVAVISFAVQFLVSLFLPYDILTLGGMRSAQDPIMLFFFLQSWVLAFAMACAYMFVEKSVKGDFWAKGKVFGFLIFVVYTLPSVWVVFTSMNYPLGFTMTQVIGGLLSTVAAGTIIAYFEQ